MSLDCIHYIYSSRINKHLCKIELNYHKKLISKAMTMSIKILKVLWAAIKACNGGK